MVTVSGVVWTDEGWRGRIQTAGRACVRTAHRLRVTLHVDNKCVVEAPLTDVHVVDVSELAHDLALVGVGQNV